MSLKVRRVHLNQDLKLDYWHVLSWQVLAQLNLPVSTLSLVEEKGDLERISKPWELVPSGHTIGCPEPIFSEMVCLSVSPKISILQQRPCGISTDGCQRSIDFCCCT